MSDAWQILRDTGLPMDGERAGPPGDPADVAAAVKTAIAGEPSGRASEALAAFVLAWHGHWPSSFAHHLGGAEVAWAEAHAIDRGRYLKLRRIALANLASIL